MYNPARGAEFAKLKQVLSNLLHAGVHGADISVALLRLYSRKVRTIASHLCVSSLSLSASLSGSPSLAFQRSSQSEEILLAPNSR